MERAGCSGSACIDLVVSAVNCSHVQSMAKDKSDSLTLAEVSQPIPGEEALDANSEVLSVGPDRLQEGVRCGGHVSVEDDLAIGIEDAKVRGLGMKVDPAVVGVLLGVGSHRPNR